MEDGRRYEVWTRACGGLPFCLQTGLIPKESRDFRWTAFSLDIASGKYFYDLEGNAQDVVAAETGIAEFFKSVF